MQMSISADAHLALTFDDGPDPVWTPAIRDALDRCQARATFFVIAQTPGDCAAMRSTREDGHEIELHCHRHVRHSDLREEEIEHDARTALDLLSEAGEHPTLWRAPWGVATPASRRVARRLGLRLVGWDIDTHDWRGDSAATMLADIGPDVASGGSVLMHDGFGPGARRTSVANTLELLPALVGAARDAGLSVGPLRPDAP
jgi:peptidoglycan/xylan/chitin deacetylase (PgdA/CDA1 family)